jgi:hypothetical protein
MSYRKSKLCHKVTKPGGRQTLEQTMAQIAATAAQSSPAQYELGITIQNLPVNESLGWTIGRDFAQHGLTPPVEHLFNGSPLRQGWHAGKASFGQRTLRPRRYTQLWLQLRTYAWSRGRSFEEVQLTPNYLQQIDTGVCPITRQTLNERAGDINARSIDRVRRDAGYAAGNLAVMSHAANSAKAQHGYASALGVAQSAANGPLHRIAGLDTVEWQRIAVLASYVTELAHEEAALIPMTVLPPNRLRLFNPIQALQALVTRELATPGWSHRLARLEELLPTEACRGDFNRFVLALAPRMLVVNKLQDPQQIRWALEDAWQHALIQKRWSRFALQMTAAQAQALVHRAVERGLVKVRVQEHARSTATEGWALERKGFSGVAAAVSRAGPR